MEKLMFLEGKDSFAESLTINNARAHVLMDMLNSKVLAILKTATAQSEALARLLNDIDEAIPDGLSFPEAIAITYKFGQANGYAEGRQRSKSK